MGCRQGVEKMARTMRGRGGNSAEHNWGGQIFEMRLGGWRKDGVKFAEGEGRNVGEREGNLGNGCGGREISGRDWQGGIKLTGCGG